jgi:hypothetical protein
VLRDRSELTEEVDAATAWSTSLNREDTATFCIESEIVKVVRAVERSRPRLLLAVRSKLLDSESYEQIPAGWDSGKDL